MNAQEFMAKWRGVDLKERSFYQEHFLDLCALIDHPTPAASDPTGERFTFEADAGRGFADVWIKGFFDWEYKGKRGDLDGAHDQLLRYRESLQNPPLLIAADAHLIRIHTNFTNSVKREYELELAELADPGKLALLRHTFFEPQRLKAHFRTSLPYRPDLLDCYWIGTQFPIHARAGWVAGHYRRGDLHHHLGGDRLFPGRVTRGRQKRDGSRHRAAQYRRRAGGRWPKFLGLM